MTFARLWPSVVAGLLVASALRANVGHSDTQGCTGSGLAHRTAALASPQMVLVGMLVAFGHNIMQSTALALHLRSEVPPWAAQQGVSQRVSFVGGFPNVLFVLQCSAALSLSLIPI